MSHEAPSAAPAHSDGPPSGRPAAPGATQADAAPRGGADPDAPWRLRTRLVILAVLVGGIGAFVATALSWHDPSQVTAGRVDLPFVRTADCRRCHEAIYDEWAESLHAGAWLDAVYQRERHATAPGYCTSSCHLDAGGPALVARAAAGLRLAPACLTGAGNEDCAPCHVPFTMYATGIGHRVLNRQEDRALGIDCLACHMDPAQGMAGGIQNPVTDRENCRPIFDARQRSVALCEPCHNQHETVEEWRRSPYAGGRDCAACHMPVIERPIVPGGSIRKSRSHRWFGAHNLERFPGAITLEIDNPGGGPTLELVLTNMDVGHNFPTDTRFRTAELLVRVTDPSAGSGQAPAGGVRDPRDFLHLDATDSPVAAARGFAEFRPFGDGREGLLVEHLQYFFRDQGGLRNTLRPFERRRYRLTVRRAEALRLEVALVVRLVPLGRNPAPTMSTVYLEDAYDLEALPAVQVRPPPDQRVAANPDGEAKIEWETRAALEARLDAALSADAPADRRAGFAPLLALIDQLGARDWRPFDDGGQPRPIPAELLPAAAERRAWSWYLKELLVPPPAAPGFGRQASGGRLPASGFRLQASGPEARLLGPKPEARSLPPALSPQPSALSPAPPPLEALGFEAHAPWHQHVAAFLAAEWEDPRLTGYLAAALRDPDFAVQASAAWALGVRGDRSALVDLAEREFTKADLKLGVDADDPARRLDPRAENLAGLGLALLGSKWGLPILYNHWAADPARGAANVPWMERFLQLGLDADDPRGVFEKVLAWQQGDGWFHRALAGQSPDHTDPARLRAKVEAHLRTMGAFSFYAADRSRKVLWWTGAPAWPLLEEHRAYPLPVVREGIVEILEYQQAPELDLLLWFLLDDEAPPVQDKALRALTAFDAAEVMRRIDLGPRHRRDLSWLAARYTPARLAQVLQRVVQDRGSPRRLVKTLVFLDRMRLTLPDADLALLGERFAGEEEVQAALDRLRRGR